MRIKIGKKVLIMTLTVVGLIGNSWTFDRNTFQYLLDDKLNAFGERLTWEISDAILADTEDLIRDELSDVTKNFQLVKTLLEETRKRVSNLESQNRLLEDLVNNLQGSSTVTKQITSVTKTAQAGTQIAIADPNSNDIHLIDPENNYRWTMKGPRGIRRIVYHPIPKLFYAVVLTSRSWVTAINYHIYGKDRFLKLRRCSVKCFSLALDIRENTLYFTEENAKGLVHLNRMHLDSSAVDGVPLRTMAASHEPREMSVDEDSKNIFIIMRGTSTILQLGYEGNVVREIHLDSIGEWTMVSMALDTADKMLYYHHGRKMYKNKYVSGGRSEFVAATPRSSPSGLLVVGDKLAVGYMGSQRIDAWTQKDDFVTWFDLQDENADGSKNMCLFG